MVSKSFIIKYVVRLCHMFTVCALSGKIIFEYLYCDYNSSEAVRIFSSILGIILILSGVINAFLLKPSENLRENKPLWMGIVYFKFVITVLILTDIPIAFGIKRSTHLVLQFYTIILLILISPFLKMYREYFTELHKSTQFNYQSMQVSSANNNTQPFN